MNEMMILDEVQEDSGTTDTFDEKDFENFLNFCKDDDRAQADVKVSDEYSSSKKKLTSLKSKVKEVTKTILKKIRNPSSNRVKTEPSSCVKMAFGASITRLRVELENHVGKDVNEESRDKLTLRSE